MRNFCLELAFAPKDCFCPCIASLFRYCHSSCRALPLLLYLSAALTSLFFRSNSTDTRCLVRYYGHREMPVQRRPARRPRPRKLQGSTDKRHAEVGKIPSCGSAEVGNRVWYAFLYQTISIRLRFMSGSRERRISSNDRACGIRCSCETQLPLNPAHTKTVVRY